MSMYMYQVVQINMLISMYEPKQKKASKYMYNAAHLKRKKESMLWVDFLFFTFAEPHSCCLF